MDDGIANIVAEGKVVHRVFRRLLDYSLSCSAPYSFINMAGSEKPRVCPIHENSDRIFGGILSQSTDHRGDRLLPGLTA